MNSLEKEWYQKPEKPFHYKDVRNTSEFEVDLEADSVLNNLTSNYSEIRGFGAEGMSTGAQIISGILLAMLILITIFGNLLVLVTIRNNRRLQTNTNCFIFNLSVTDLLLGIFVLPLSAVNTLASEWEFGAHACNIYISTDVMLCTVSILQLFFISQDRFFAVQYPFHHIRLVNRRRILILIAFIWLFSAIIGYSPIFMGWNTASGNVQNHDAPHICSFENTSRAYVLSIAIGTFFIPLVFMGIAYVFILCAVCKQTKRINELTRYGTVQTNGHGNENKPSAHQVSDTKATTTLFWVMLTFTLCWFPYFSLFTAKAFNHTFDMLTDNICLWLGYANSMMNPILYAFINSEFRYGFLQVLCKERAAKYREAHPDIVHL